MKSANIEDKFPVIAIENGLVVNINGSVTVCMKMQLKEVYTMSDTEYSDINNLFCKAVKILPDNSVIHKQDWFKQRKYETRTEGRGDGMSFLAMSNERSANERYFLDHETMMFITLGDDDIHKVGLFNTVMGRKNIVPKKMLDDGVIGQFIDSVKNIVDLFNQSGIPTSIMSPSEIMSYKDGNSIFDRYINLAFDGKDSVLDDIIFNDNYIRIGQKTAFIYAITSNDNLPPTLGIVRKKQEYSTDKYEFNLSLGNMLGLELGVDHIYNQIIYIPNQNEVIKNLTSKKDNMRSVASYSADNLTNMEDYEEYFKKATIGGRVVLGHFNVIAYTENSADVKMLSNDVNNAFLKLDIYAKQLTADVIDAFWGCIPTNATGIPKEMKFYSFHDTATMLFNLETNYYDDYHEYVKKSLAIKGVMLNDRKNLIPLLVDMSDIPMQKGWITNRNKFILGPSGSGKSFLTNHMIRHYYEQGSHLVIIDVGDSYQMQSKIVGGKYYQFEREEDLKFNPFYSPDGRPSQDTIENLIKTLIFTLWKADKTDRKPSEYSLVSEFINGYYDYIDAEKEKGNEVFQCFNSFYEYVVFKIPEDLKQDQKEWGKVSKEFDFDNFEITLRPYYKGGQFSQLLNSTDRYDLKNDRFIIFELDKIKDHPILFPVVTLVIMNTYLEKLFAKDDHIKNARKIILIEEAWKAIMTDEMAGFMKYLFKTVRKHYGEAWVVTQEADDILASPVVKESILTNADTKILLDQRKYENKFEEIQAVLGLTHNEVTKVMSINKDNKRGHRYKEMFVGLGSNSKVYSLCVSPEEVAAYTTEKIDKMEILELDKKYNGDTVQAIRQYVENKSS